MPLAWLLQGTEPAARVAVNMTSYVFARARRSSVSKAGPPTSRFACSDAWSFSGLLDLTVVGLGSGMGAIGDIYPSPSGEPPTRGLHRLINTQLTTRLS
jgi:hypothetical protein